jgi:hypothetical protein
MPRWPACRPRLCLRPARGRQLPRGGQTSWCFLVFVSSCLRVNPGCLTRGDDGQISHEGTKATKNSTHQAENAAMASMSPMAPPEAGSGTAATPRGGDLLVSSCRRFFVLFVSSCLRVNPGCLTRGDDGQISHEGTKATKNSTHQAENAAVASMSPTALPEAGSGTAATPRGGGPPGVFSSSCLRVFV